MCVIREGRNTRFHKYCGGETFQAQAYAHSVCNDGWVGNVSAIVVDSTCSEEGVAPGCRQRLVVEEAVIDSSPERRMPIDFRVYSFGGAIGVVRVTDPAVEGYAGKNSPVSGHDAIGHTW